MASTRNALDTLLQRLLLGEEAAFGGVPREYEFEYAVKRAVDVLDASAEQREAFRFHLRLRLAMHLAPAEALAYSGTNPTPRHQLIAEYLRNGFGREGAEVDALARDVAKVLIDWDEERQALASWAPILLKRQTGRCAHCHVRFSDPALVWTVKIKDEFKPYFHAQEELLRAEVDHVEAVSCLGTNEPSNLQVLCRLCNAGKGDGLGLDVRDELSSAGLAITDVTRIHRCRMLYHVIARFGRACACCGRQNSELTVRFVRAAGGYVRTNLETRCEACASR